jgi:hypothetical protein
MLSPEHELRGLRKTEDIGNLRQVLALGVAGVGDFGEGFWASLASLIGAKGNGNQEYPNNRLHKMRIGVGWGDFKPPS